MCAHLPAALAAHLACLQASLASTRAQAPARPPPPAGLRLTDGCLALLRTHKKGQCTAQLLEMDFTFDRAMVSAPGSAPTAGGLLQACRRACQAGLLAACAHGGSQAA